MKRFWPFLAVLLPFAAVAYAPLRGLAGHLLLRDYPRHRTETLKLDGLGAPVEVVWDRWGVPHISAQSERDLVRAVGFVHGQERFFEMDLSRRLARGRLSELTGERPFLSGTTVDFDLSMRGWGFDRRAEIPIESFPAEDRAILETYAAGVNAALRAFRPLEYRLLGVEPEPWRPQDTLALGLLNAWSLTHNWHQEATRLVLAMNVGVERASRIYPHEPLGRPSLGSRGPRRELPPAVAPELRELLGGRPYRADAQRQGEGLLAGDIVMRQPSASNGWVLSGARTATGMPIHANDMHMSHFLPSLMFQQHLKAPGLEVIGFTIPGVPFNISGRTRRLSWGATAAVADAIDLVVEKEDPADPSRVLDERRACAVETEAVELLVRRGGRLVTEKRSLRRTCHGPVFNDIYPDLLPPGSPLVSVRWEVRGLERTMSALRAAARSRTVRELRRSLMPFPTPNQNVQAADRDGHIALFVTGRVPLRPNHRGTFPVPGWKAKYEWPRFSSPEEMPAAFDAPGGVLANANNLAADPRTGALPIQVDSAPSYRNDRIQELLRASKAHTVESVARVQTDVKLPRAERVLPFLLADLRALEGAPPAAREALAALERWDLGAGADSVGAAVFQATYRRAVIDALADELDAPGLHFFLAQRYSTNVCDGWFEDPEHPVWDHRGTAARERRREAVQKSFLAAVAELAARLGPDVASWRWGRVHALQPRHPFGKGRLLGRLFNLPERGLGGGLDSVWKAHFDLSQKDPFRVVAGPVNRMVVDLGGGGAWIIDTGSSGWPLSPHYGDQYELWGHGELIPMVMDWENLRRDAEGILTLR